MSATIDVKDAAAASTVSVVVQAVCDGAVDTVFAVSEAPATRLAQAPARSIPRFEWSTNEKVAAEAAVGLSAAGRRSALVFKHCGLHVALDPAGQRGRSRHRRRAGRVLR